MGKDLGKMLVSEENSCFGIRRVAVWGQMEVALVIFQRIFAAHKSSTSKLKAAIDCSDADLLFLGQLRRS